MILHLLIPNVDIMWEQSIKITYRMFLVAFYKYVFVAFSKTYGKSSFFFLSFFSFLTLYQYLWSKLAKSCFNKYFYRSLQSSREQALRYARGSWLRTVNVSITCRVWHHDASNSSNGLPVISGSHATHWNRKSRTSSLGLFPKKRGGVGKGHFGFFFLRKSPGDEPSQGVSTR